MTTFNELVEDALSMLRGYVRSQDTVTYLAAAIDAATTTVPVGHGSRLGMGRIEVDDELLFVDSVSGNTAVVAPWGRGVDGTTAESHAVNSRVTFSPLFPRSQVKTAINATIKAIGKELQVPGVTTFPFTTAQVTYGMPADANAVTAVSWSTVGPSRRWQPVKRWSFNQVANTTAFATGKTIDVMESITPGRTVQVNYLKFPSALSANSDTLESTAGLPDSCRDVVTYGAASRLVSGVDVALLDPTTVSAGFFDERRAPGSGSQVARTLYALYQQRLAEEVDRFRDQFPTPVHYRR